MLFTKVKNKKNITLGFKKDISMDKITIRPSSISGFVNCAYQWYNVNVLGVKTIPSARANIGTAIHKAAEVLWTDAIKTGNKDCNLTKLKDAAIQQYQQLDKEEGIFYNDGENKNTAEKEVVTGTKAFSEDIVPYTDIPIAVEKRLVYKLNNPIAGQLAGTVDYITKDTIADIKTSGRKIYPGKHILQQSVYNFLAIKNGINVSKILIQGVVLPKKTQPYGEVLKLKPNMSRVMYIVNNILESLKILSTDKVDPKILFRGNPEHFMCNNKYCSLYSTCPFVNGMGLST